MPAQKNLSVWKGNTFKLPLTISTLSNGVSTPMDLTGSSLVFRSIWSGGSLRKATGDSGFSIVSAAAGTALLSLTVAETRTLPNGNVKYEIERRVGSEQTTILFGELNCREWVNDD